MKNSRARLPGWFWILLAALVLGFAFALDEVVAYWALLLQTPGRTAAMKTISRLGDGLTYVIAGSIGMIVAYAIGNRRWTIIFAATILACVMAGLLHPILKFSTGRARPSVVATSQWNGPSRSAKFQSFPSGHTIASAAFVSALLCASRRVGLALLPVPMAIAVSRLYLNAHHFSDVMAGAILGFGCGMLAWKILSPRLEKVSWLRG